MMACEYKTIFSKNLSNNSDEKFKLAKITIANDKHLYFEIRQTDKGQLQRDGIVMTLPVFLRFKKNFVKPFINKYKLEYSNRYVTYVKNKEFANKVYMEQLRSKDDIRSISLNQNEQSKLIEALDDIENELTAKSIELNCSIDFDETCYFKETYAENNNLQFFI